LTLPLFLKKSNSSNINILVNNSKSIFLSNIHEFVMIVFVMTEVGCAIIEVGFVTRELECAMIVVGFVMIELESAMNDQEIGMIEVLWSAMIELERVMIEVQEIGMIDSATIECALIDLAMIIESGVMIEPEVKIAAQPEIETKIEGL